ncbi:hypothetical protein C7M61_005279 [Candidozyma pseudohaemuli]|uniref:Uncharacterized protein n=1 Tax=Candidozyma pseudohaemuli TaxID=418784 RepID=A0A2P7YCG1_9ASCO|nr:hypothetical protein C7M61_005279 [[Candida] pseudohaemulonii]PSK33669.1 hypothetical protein C7M61_005279 [[Candida] pseudohaemulonii]
MATKSYEFETQGRHKSANVIQVELMHMDVDRIQEVFETHFLQPNDKILLWKVISCKDINNTISDLRILLGLNKVPPMTPTAEILLQNLRLQGSEDEDDPITKYFRSYMKFFEAADWEDEESAAEALSVYNFAKDLFETSERNHINRIKELEDGNAHKDVIAKEVLITSKQIAKEKKGELVPGQGEEANPGCLCDAGAGHRGAQQATFCYTSFKPVSVDFFNNM